MSKDDVAAALRRYADEARGGDVLDDHDAAFMRSAADHIDILSARLAEAQDNQWPFGKRPNPVSGHTFGDFAVWGDEKSIKRVQSSMHEYDAVMPARVRRIQELTARAEAAEARVAELERERDEATRLNKEALEVLRPFTVAPDDWTVDHVSAACRFIAKLETSAS